MQITLQAGVSGYRIPYDLARFIPETDYNWTAQKRLFSKSTSEWTRDDALSINQDGYKIVGQAVNKFYITPTPTTTGEIIVRNYISKIWTRPQRWLLGKTYALDEIVWFDYQTYICTSGGQAGGQTSAYPWTEIFYTEHVRESELSGLAPTHVSGSVSDGGCTWQYFESSHADFITDADMPILDDTLVQLALEYAILRHKGFDWAKAWEELQARVSLVSTSLSGSEPIYITNNSAYFNPQLPEGGWVL